MSRSIILSNGELCVALDDRALVRDIYFPFVGLEDHVRGHYIHRVGVYVSGTLSWFTDPSWDIQVLCEETSLASQVIARNNVLQIEVRLNDIVYNEKPIFLRKIEVTNLSHDAREIKLYLAHQFEIGKTHGGETAYYDPVSHSVIHYKGKRVFLMSALLDHQPFDDYAVGIANFQGHEGSHRDAEDGLLSKNAIEHGQVDSVLGLYQGYAGGQTRTSRYWMVAATSITDALALNEYCRTKTPEHIMRTAGDYWKAWSNTYNRHFHGLTGQDVALFSRSMLYIRAHVDKGGGILASLDSDMLHHGLDTYSYVWPRDAAYTALALDRAGDSNVARRFFDFCRSVMTVDGYLMHKYLPDGSLGSSWHPWIKDDILQLPIQEDETALIVIALFEHYKHSRDLEFLEDSYNQLVEAPANFMVEYRDSATKLPKASYDLWEEKRGTSTYTSAAVFGALVAAAELSTILGKKNHAARYREAAEEIKEGILKYLWDEQTGVFLKTVNCGEKGCVEDRTVDMSSAYGVFSFGVLDVTDARLRRAFENSVRILSQGVMVGGMGRYEGDSYYAGRYEGDAFFSGGKSVSNPWFVTTLWYAEYLIASAQNESDLLRAKDIFAWVAKYALPSGVLSEQIHPQTGAQLSAAPLAWSHASYVNAVILYLDKLKVLGICVDCNPAP